MTKSRAFLFSLAGQTSEKKESAGIRSLNLPIQSNLQGTNPTIALVASPAYGFALGAHLSDENVVEFRWTRQNSHAEIQGSSFVSSEVPITLDQFYCNLSHEYIPRHRASWARPFLIASIGATNVISETNSNAIGFTVGIGAGVKLLAGRHLGFRMQIEWLPTFWSEQGVVGCGADCVVHVGGNLVSQTEIAGGPMIRF